jgi:methyl-accepting chemotaxis protein
MMEWTIRNALIGMALVGVAGTAVVAAVGYRNVQHTLASEQRVNDATAALRAAMTADMMHDALRADVLRSIFAARTAPGEQGEVLGDLREHSSTFRVSLADSSLTRGDSVIQRDLATLQPALNTYITTAEEISVLAFRDRAAAEARFPEFQDAFKVLEGQMEELGTAVEQQSLTETASAATSQRASRWFITGFLLLSLAGSMVVAWLVVRQILGSLGKTLFAIEGAAGGDLTVETGVTSRDEFGTMARALDTLLQSFRTSIREIAGNSTTLSSTAEGLTRVSQALSAGAEETSVQANVVARATEGVNRNVQTVTTASEEMSASIQEISRNAGQAARVAADAVLATETANQTMGRLGTSSNEIGAVVKTITSIAEQTNLLALNATIEAARAGEAGKGFAVVANEVKELAKETARATEDISRKVQAIQADTESAVQAIQAIGQVVAQISAAQTTIASAVEEQTATTNEINRNLVEAASGASEIAQNVGGVAEAAAETTRGASNTQSAASELSRMAANLSSLVTRFHIGETEVPKAAAPGRGRRYGAARAHAHTGYEDPVPS